MKTELWGTRLYSLLAKKKLIWNELHYKHSRLFIIINYN